MTEGSNLEALEQRLARHERARALEAAVDGALEQALRERRPLERVMPRLLELLCAHLGASAAALRTLDESLVERTFSHGEPAVDHGLIERAQASASRIEMVDHGCALAHGLDVAGEPFGTAVVFFARAPEAVDEPAELLERFCEKVDNHLGAIAQSRRKFEVIRSISDALKEPVLDRGIEQACELLRREVDFEDLVLLFRHEDEAPQSALRYAIYQDGVRVHDVASADPELDDFMRANAAAFLQGDDAAVRARFGIARGREEVLITGVREARVIGRMLVSSRQGEFHTYDRELLDRFADYLRQRIVDFNRERKRLALVFSNEVCERLLREEGYIERWLSPREAETAILYTDIAGFTRFSEQVLKTPEAVGRLISTWAGEAVRIIWETGGVFDKMIGDCLIGMWGPPFFEHEPAERCRRALEAATRIRAYTRSLVTHPDLPELHGLDEPFEVATGVSYCPLSVGLFGPSEDYTGFSSGMNNTARLQGVARGGEILCMRDLVEALGEPSRFGEERQAAVKNVADPLVFRALRDCR